MLPLHLSLAAFPFLIAPKSRNSATLMMSFWQAPFSAACHRQKWSAVASTNLVENSVTWALSLKYSPVHRVGDPQCETETETSQWAGLPLLPSRAKALWEGRRWQVQVSPTTLNLLWSTQAFTRNIYGIHLGLPSKMTPKSFNSFLQKFLFLVDCPDPVSLISTTGGGAAPPT